MGPSCAVLLHCRAECSNARLGTISGVVLLDVHSTHFWRHRLWLWGGKRFSLQLLFSSRNWDGNAFIDTSSCRKQSVRLHTRNSRHLWFSLTFQQKLQHASLPMFVGCHYAFTSCGTDTHADRMKTQRVVPWNFLHDLELCNHQKITFQTWNNSGVFCSNCTRFVAMLGLFVHHLCTRGRTGI